MRGHAALTLALLVALPAVSALALPHAAPPPSISGAAVPALPADLSDGDLVRLLAAHAGYHPVVPKLVVPSDATLATLATALGARAGVSVPAEDAARFAALDARVQAPALALLLAVDQAWDLRDQAFAKLSHAQQIELLQLAEARMDARSTTITPREAELYATVDKEPLFAAAILLLDTIDGTVTPLVQDAVAAGAWPATATADPVGVLRIGGTGNDLETIDRIVQLDPRGDDEYRNNAGGTSLLDDLSATTIDYNIAVSLDYSGNDLYGYVSHGAQGYGGAGVGILQDYGGNDRYDCGTACQGSDVAGIGILRDHTGNDTFASLFRSSGYGDVLSVSRDDAGTDAYVVGDLSGGVSSDEDGTGLFWDRNGTDSYQVDIPGEYSVYGWSDSGGRGWFVDEGSSVDSYEALFAFPHTCNSCSWLAGRGGPHSAANGRGNDNRGGLAALLSEDGALLRP